MAQPAAAPQAPAAAQRPPGLSYVLAYSAGDDPVAARAWVAQAQRAATVFGWTQQQASAWAGLQMRGAAAEWLADCDPATVATFTDFIAAFRVRFCPAVSQERLQALVASRMQAAGETPRQYWRALSGVYRRFQPAVPAEHQFSRFVAGLSAKAKEYVKLSRTTTVAAALTLLDAMGDDMTTPDVVAEVDVAPVFRRGRGGDDLRSVVEQLREEVRELRMSGGGGGGGSAGGHQPAGRVGGGGSTRPRAAPGPGEICYLCDAMDHFVYKCPWRRVARSAVLKAKGPEGPGAAASGATEPAGAEVQAVSGQLRLPVELGGGAAKATALVDTGAAVSLLSGQTAAALPNSTLRPYAGPPLRAANDKDMAPTGVLLTQVALGDQLISWQFVVVPELSTPVILGQDFLQQACSTIDLAGNCLVLQSGVRVPLCDRGPPGAVLYVARVVVIPPRSSAPVMVGHGGVGGAFFEAVPRAPVKVPHLLAVGTAQDVWVANTSDDRVVLPAGLELARRVECEEVEAGEVTAAAVQEARLGEPAETAAHLQQRTEPPEPGGEDTAVAGSQPAEGKPTDELTWGEDLPPALKTLLWRVVDANSDLFSSGTGPVNVSDVPPMHIETQGPPVAVPPRRYSAREARTIDEHVAAMLAAGAIRPSTSPYSAPVVLVRKKSGEIRFCVDYRRLNNTTARDVYPLPRVDTILGQLRRCRLFTALDLARGYWQVPLAPAHIHKTAFATPTGLYEFVVVPFGLTNAPAAFQRAMDDVFKGILGVFVFVFLDDIIVASEDPEDHPRHLEAVLERLRGRRLQLKAKKCTIATRSVEFLGHVVSAQGICMEPAKVQAMVDMPAPKDRAGVRRLLGLFSYYRAFVPAFSTTAEPLTRLLRKSSTWTWGAAQRTAVRKLKSALLRAPTMAYPDPTKPFTVATDASDVGIGAAVSQRQPDGEHRPVGFFSRTLNSAERNYTTTERECLAVVWVLKLQHHWFDGNVITVETDHAALTWLFAGTQPRSPRVERWVMDLQRFSLRVVHRPGTEMSHADALSRAAVAGADDTVSSRVHGGEDFPGAPAAVFPAPGPPVFIGGIAVRLPAPQTSAPAVVTLPSRAKGARHRRTETSPPQSQARGMAAREAPTPSTLATQTPRLPAPRPLDKGPTLVLQSWPPNWGEEQERCPWSRQFGRWLRTGEGSPPADVKPEAVDTYGLRNGAVVQFRAGQARVWVPPHRRADVLEEAHRGHVGIHRMAARVSNEYVWPGWHTDVRRYAAACAACQRTSPAPRRQVGRRGALNAVRPWQLVAMDMAGPLPTTPSGKRFILLVVDHFTRYVVAEAVSSASAATAAQFWVERVVARFGAPEQLLSDNGTNFVAQLFAEVCRLTGSRRRLTTAYSPQGDSRAERHIQTIKRTLRRMAEECGGATPWDRLLQWAVLAHNASQSRATGETPHFLVHGAEPRMGWSASSPSWGDLDPKPGQTATEAHRARLLRAVARAAAAVVRAQAADSEHTAAETQRQRDLAVGASVLLWRPRRYPGGAVAGGAWDGPLRVVAAPTTSTRRVAAGTGDRSVLVNVRRLRPYRQWAPSPDGEEGPAVGPLSPSQELAEVELTTRARSTGGAWLRHVTEAVRRAAGR